LRYADPKKLQEPTCMQDATYATLMKWKVTSLLLFVKNNWPKVFFRQPTWGRHQWCTCTVMEILQSWS